MTDSEKGSVRALIGIVMTILLMFLASKIFMTGIEGNKEQPLVWILSGIAIFILSIPISIIFSSFILNK